MLAWYREGRERRREALAAVRRDARELISADERNAFYNANRLARMATLEGDAASSWHWKRVAAECCRVSDCEMDTATLARAVREVEEAWSRGKVVEPFQRA